MKTITLREQQSPYQIDLDDVALSTEVLILEKEGRPVAAVIPHSEYEAFRAWRAAKDRRQTEGEEATAIDQAHETFQEMLPELLKLYPGHVVALYQGQVVAVGDDRMEVWQQARQQLGNVPVYVQTVEASSRIYRMPYRKTVHVEL